MAGGGVRPLQPLLLERCCNVPLFPRLQLLEIFSPSTHTAKLIPYLSSKSLKSVTVTFTGDGYHYGRDSEDGCIFDELLKMLCASFHDLQALYLRILNSGSPFPLQKRHIDQLPHFSRLQHFLAHMELEPNAWSQIATLASSLQHLDLVLNGWGTMPTSYSLEFPGLRSLNLKGPIKALSAFLEGLESPNLHSFSFEIPYCEDALSPESLEDLCGLGKEKLPPSLRRFSLKCHKLVRRAGSAAVWSRSRRDIVPLSLATLLAPLTSFSELEGLSIDLSQCGVDVRVSDEDIRALSSAFPQLTELALRYPPELDSRSDENPLRAENFDRLGDQRPTLGALRTLAVGCPRLARLHLADVDADADSSSVDIEGVASIPARPGLGHPLRELEICSIGTESQQGAFELAVKLDELFPNLMNVRSRDIIMAPVGGSWVSHRSLWDVTNTCIGFMQYLRSKG
ncbi:hypothetical protein V8D89_001119 [Ganoderma adspersum]